MDLIFNLSPERRSVEEVEEEGDVNGDGGDPN
jgi:hypothetical protein